MFKRMLLVGLCSFIVMAEANCKNENGDSFKVVYEKNPSNQAYAKVVEVAGENYFGGSEESNWLWLKSESGGFYGSEKVFTTENGGELTIATTLMIGRGPCNRAGCSGDAKYTSAYFKKEQGDEVVFDCGYSRHIVF